jgi:hypothetical protein
MSIRFAGEQVFDREQLQQRVRFVPAGDLVCQKPASAACSVATRVRYPRTRARFLRAAAGIDTMRP